MALLTVSKTLTTDNVQQLEASLAQARQQVKQLKAN
jgi:hypothetical protein